MSHEQLGYQNKAMIFNSESHQNESHSRVRSKIKHIATQSK